MLRYASPAGALAAPVPLTLPLSMRGVLADEPARSIAGHPRLTVFGRVVDAWLTMRPVPEVAALVAETRLSLRQVQRNCQTLYGRSPKALARQTRALRAAAAITADPGADYDVIEHGYYDQSHMSREIKHFRGLTPGQIRAESFAAAVRDKLCEPPPPLTSLEQNA